MIDLRSKLRAQTYTYRVQHNAQCTLVAPQDTYVNREPPPQQLMAETFLRPDRYSIGWRVGCADSNMSQRCELLVFIGSLHAPAMMYDLKQYPEYTVAFRLEQSTTVYVAVRVQGKTTFMIHSLNVMVARDLLVGHDSLMYEWDMEHVATALDQQRLLERSLTQMYMLFEWETMKTGLHTLMDKWKGVFADLLDTPTRGAHANTPELYQNTVLQCRVQSPNLLAASRDSLIGYFTCNEQGDWALNLKGHALHPTYIHAQYFIWCFPDKHIKFALRRDTPLLPNRIDFTLKGNHSNETPVWYWLGYNLMHNLPFYNLWSLPIDRLEFVNREDLLALCGVVRGHFEEVCKG